MSIVSSVILSDSPQKDGRRDIRELHIDHLGVEHLRYYLAAVEAGIDVSAALMAYANRLPGDLRDAEIDANIYSVTTQGAAADVNLLHSTAAQNFNALRRAYKSMSNTEAIFAGEFLSSMTDAKLRDAFGLTATQVTTLRTNKLTPAASAATTIRNSTGA